MTERTDLSLVVNGEPRRLDVPAHWRLLDVLRDGLGLTGTKEGCDDGTCGTCTVIADGRMVRACRVTAAEASGADVLTIEGLGDPERPHPLQAAFAAADATQCGFCTPGMIMAAASLLERNPHPTRAEITRRLGGNLCRCTGYNAIVDAIEWAAGGRKGPPRAWPASAAGQAGSPTVEDGHGAPRTDALDKATGRAVYAADLMTVGMLHGRVLRSPHPHADIVRLETGRAARMPGVAAVLTARDVPGENAYGRRFKDQPVLAASRVRQVGDPVALVVADSPEAASAALAAIEVEYRPLPVITSVDDALAEGAPAIHPAGNVLADNRVRAGGDAANALANADVVVEATFETPWNEHAYLEPEAVVAHWDGDTLVVRTPTQYAHYQQAEIARTMGLPKARVRVVPTVVGGAFGGKTEIAGQCLAALGTVRTGRPVRIVYTRAESFASTGKRHPFRIRCRAGATRAGDLVALEVDMLADTGAYASFGSGLIVKAFGSAAGPYRWSVVDLHGRTVFTNNPTSGCMRGPGTTQAAFALESLMDLLAERLGMDPLALRDRNRLRAGDRLLSGQLLDRDPAFGATIDAIRPHWEAALARCTAANEVPGTVRRGVGLAAIWYGIGGGGGGPVPGQDPALTVGRGPGRAALDLLDDGAVRLRTGVADLGQGSSTALGTIAAEEIGLPPARVRVLAGDTGLCPDAGPAVGSRVTFFVGNAVRNAAADLREAVLGTAGRLLGRPFAELQIRDGDVVGRDAFGTRLGLADVARSRSAAGLANSFQGYFDTVLPDFDPGAGLGEPYAMYVTGTQLAEVEVDTASGRVRVLRIVAAHDVGRPVFPEGVVGQIEGGVVMGLGFALTEDFVPGESHGFRQYRIPTVHDVPEMTVILVRDPGEPAELEAKGVAECANMPVAPAIMNAIAHATGRRVTRLPARLGPAAGPSSANAGRVPMRASCCSIRRTAEATTD